MRLRVKRLLILFIFSISGVLLRQLFGFLLARNLIDNRAGDAERREDTDEDADQQGEDEATDHLTAEDEHHQQGDKGGTRGIHRTSQGRVDSVVHVCDKVTFGIELAVFTHAVEDNHRGIDRVTDDGQHRRDEVLVDLQVEGEQTIQEGEDTNHKNRIVGQSRHRADTEAPAAEAEADVNEHHEQTTDNSPNVEKICVHEATEDKNGNRVQDIDIYYRFLCKVD